jgi:integrase
MRGTDGADIGSEYRYTRWQMNEDMPSRRNQKTIELLKDTEVKRWYERKIPRSYESARVRLSNLANFCEATGLMPDQIARMEEPELARVVEDFVDVERERGMKGPTIVKRVDSIRAWRQYNDKKLRKIDVPRARVYETTREKMVPTQEQLRTLLMSTPNLRTKCMILLMAHSGLRPCVIGRDRGREGLRLKAIQDLVIEDDKVEFIRVPARVMIWEELSKNNRPHSTFLSSESVEYIEAYLNERMNNGERLTGDSPLILSNGPKNKFLYATKIGESIRKIIRKVGINMRPYELRRYFSTQLQLAESRTGLTHEIVQSWMGHKCDLATSVYGLGSSNLSTKVVDELRGLYLESEPFLLTKREMNQDMLRSQIEKVILELGSSPEDSSDAVSCAVQRVVGVQPGEHAANAVVKQIVVPIEQVSAHLRQGYTFISSLNETEVILQPNLETA